MSAPLLLTLVMSSTAAAAASQLGLHLEDAGELGLATGMELVRALAAEIGGRSKRAPLVDDPLWAECSRRDRCVEEIRARLGAQDIVLLRVLATPNLVRLTLDRFFASPEVARQRIEAELPRDAARWPDALKGVAAKLTPEVAALISTAPVSPAPIPPHTVWLGWIALGTSLTAASIGIGFGLSSRSLGAEIDSGKVMPEQIYKPLADRREAQGLIADVSFVLAGAALLAGGILFLTD